MSAPCPRTLRVGGGPIKYTILGIIAALHLGTSTSLLCWVVMCVTMFSNSMTSGCVHAVKGYSRAAVNVWLRGVHQYSSEGKGKKAKIIITCHHFAHSLNGTRFQLQHGSQPRTST